MLAQKILRYEQLKTPATGRRAGSGRPSTGLYSLKKGSDAHTLVWRCCTTPDIKPFRINNSQIRVYFCLLNTTGIRMSYGVMLGGMAFFFWHGWYLNIDQPKKTPRNAGRRAVLDL
jgi:hypothetical protein